MCVQIWNYGILQKRVCASSILCRVRSPRHKSDMSMHMGEQLFACPHCVFRTTKSGFLDVHVTMHTAENPFVCPHCEFRTAVSGSLTAHVRKHTGDKPFACLHCEYRTAKNSRLKAHLWTHTICLPTLRVQDSRQWQSCSAHTDTHHRR